MLRRLMGLTVNSLPFSGFAALLERGGRQRPGILRVLTYHRVDIPQARPGLYPGLISAAPAMFERQMQHLAAHYRVISAAELLDVDRSGSGLPPRAVMITFDDAYQDFAEHAWPTLKRLRLPVTLFVPTAFPDHPERVFWWDQLYHALATTRLQQLATPLGPLRLETPEARRLAFKRLNRYVLAQPHAEAMAWVEQTCGELAAPPPLHSVLGWEALRQLAREGVTLAAHTRSHPMLDRISPDEARAEAVGSLQDLEREIGPSLPIFAYPAGQFSQQVVSQLRSAGFALGFTTQPGLNDWRRADRLRLRRINVGQLTNLPLLRARLSPWFAAFER